MKACVTGGGTRRDFGNYRKAVKADYPFQTEIMLIRGVLNMLIDLIGVGRAMLKTADWAVVAMNDDK